jgi:hypothetical protein
MPFAHIHYAPSSVIATYATKRVRNSPKSTCGVLSTLLSTLDPRAFENRFNTLDAFRADAQWSLSE